MNDTVNDLIRAAYKRIADFEEATADLLLAETEAHTLAALTMLRILLTNP